MNVKLGNLGSDQAINCSIIYTLSFEPWTLHVICKGFAEKMLMLYWSE